jgi:N-methylhydantoinase A/oxoprolinase/acetone carboxylase beta subunit
MSVYLRALDDRLKGAGFDGSLLVTRSGGGAMTFPEAEARPFETILSGPVAGAEGAAELARALGIDDLITADVGGTSFDTCLVLDGRPQLKYEGSVLGMPIQSPWVDVRSIGAGGGSLASVDIGGLLRVGPQSAGADPGPACYGKGTDATVTDAHAVLGRIKSDQFLGGAMHLDVARAESAIDAIARALKMSRRATAEGIIRVANSNMERAIRAVSVERGYDPRDFALLAFGGCGGLHACEVAEALGIATIIVPEHAGVLSAAGMLIANRRRDYSAAVLGRTDIDRQFATLERQARKDLPRGTISRYGDMRYAGQSYELTIPWQASFHEAHEKAYGYADTSRAVETVAIRVRAVEPVPRLKFAPARHKTKKPAQGPALIADYGSTTYVPAGWRYVVDRAGNLIINR